jgi:hypothetical protein
MREIKESMLSSNIVELLYHTNSIISPNEIKLYSSDNLPMGVEAQADKENTTIVVNSKHINDYVLSHELLHFQSEYA